MLAGSASCRSSIRAFHQRIVGAGCYDAASKVATRNNETAPPSAHPFPDQGYLAGLSGRFIPADAWHVCGQVLGEPVAGASSSAG
jgi:hypothetical protein